MSNNNKRDYGDGGIEQRGPDVWRLRYRVGRRRFSRTVRGTKAEARKELRRLLKSGDDGAHVAPAKLTFAQWMELWFEIKAAVKKKARPKTLARYREILERHVVPTIGQRHLQQIETTDINRLYINLDPDLSARSRHHVHVVLKGCMQAAVRNKKITTNPVADAEAPAVGDSDGDGDDEKAIGQVLDAEQLATLVRGFKGTTIYDIVAVAAITGMRRGEVLALRWSDFGAKAKTLRIDRALEYTRNHGLAFKAPKTARGRRTITIDDSLIELLLRVQEQQRRMVAGVTDGATAAVDLALVKLPDTALIFPAPDSGLTSPRHPDAVSKIFRGHADKLGFVGFRFHDLRGSCETIQLDDGVPVHTVAARTGHDPAVLLRIYAKRTKKSDQAAADVMGKLARTLL